MTAVCLLLVSLAAGHLLAVNGDVQTSMAYCLLAIALCQMVNLLPDSG